MHEFIRDVQKGCHQLINIRNYEYRISLIINMKTYPLFTKFEKNMFENIIIKYFHPGLQVGIQDIRNVWLLENNPVKLITTLHREI